MKRFFTAFIFILLCFQAYAGEECPLHDYYPIYGNAQTVAERLYYLGMTYIHVGRSIYAGRWCSNYFCEGDNCFTLTPILTKYSGYRYKFDNLSLNCDEQFSYKIKQYEELIQKREQELLDKQPRKKKKEKKLEIDDYRKNIEEIRIKWKEAVQFIESGILDTMSMFLNIYNKCTKEHNDPIVFYERGLIFFDRGDTIEFLEDISRLIETGKAEKYVLTDSNYSLSLGKGYLEVNLYDSAISTLSEAIQKNPENKEAYFERAVAYFETGQFDLALTDYIASNIRPTILDPTNEIHFSHTEFSKGFVLGCLKGGADSAVDFIPSLLSTAFGIGKGLWAFSSDPIKISKEIVESCRDCVEFIKDNFSSDLIKDLIPELRKCLEQWDQLDEDKKGYYIGYVIGRYGVDILAWSASIRALHLYKNIKRANSSLVLESCRSSSGNAKTIFRDSEEFLQFRTSYLEKCKINIGAQSKHIPGSHNYKKNTSDLLISLTELETETKSKMGMGLKSRGKFGEPGFQEFIEYDKVIGVFYTEEGVALQTKCAKVHYNKKGEYHVVPSHPKIFDFKKNNG